MKILLVTDLYPLFEGEAGIPLTIRDFALGFKTLGHEVFVFRPNFMFNTFLRKRETYKGGIYENDGIKIYNKNFILPFKKESVLKVYEKYILPLGKIPETVNMDNFDIILGHMPSGVMCADIIAKKYNIPMLLAVHSSDIKVMTDFKYAMFKERMISAYRRANCILPRSFWLKDKIRKIIPDLKRPVEIIYSGVPYQYTKENEDKILNGSGRKFNPKKAKILTVASLIKRKNIKTLILAYRKLKKKHKGITFEIIGDGKLKQDFEILNIKYGLNIKMPGHLEKDKILEKMQEADIFVLPSKNETFGMAYMEALASGMVVCCSKNSGIDGIINDGENGYTLKPTARGVYDALNKILNLKPKQFLEISKNALVTSKMFSYENSVKNYLEKMELFKL